MDLIFSALRFIGIMLLVIMVFNLMIVVHEWGHFLAARWRGLRVDAFQIWFGKTIWKKTINGVQYGLGTIPFGGFVKLPQMGPMDAIEGQTEGVEPLPPISQLDKIIVAFAGPLFSFLLAVFFAVIVWQVGKPESVQESTRTIGYVKKDSPAERAGLQPGDEVESIDGKPVRSFRGMVDSITWYIVASEGSKIDFLVKRPGHEEPILIAVNAEKPKVDPNLSWFKKLITRPPFRQVGISPAYPLTVGDFMDNKPNSPAQQAGFQKGDHLLAVDGVHLYSPFQLSDYLASRVGQTLKFDVERHGKTLTLPVTTRLPDQLPKDWDVKEDGFATLGLRFDAGERTTRHPAVLEQIKDAGRTIVQTLRSITSPKSDLSAQHLSGFIGIMHSYVVLFEDPAGFQLVLWFSVVLNVNLAIINLLPFPVLDGGHIVMALLEWVRRRPINLRFLEVVQTACVVLLLGFMVFISMKDTGDLFGASQRAKDGKAPDPQNEVEPKFTQPALQGH